MDYKKLLAFDFGASSGRAMLGNFDGSKIELQEIHRFSNDPVMINGTLYWDILRLFYEIKQGLVKSKAFGQIDSIGIDTWGVDFGLLDKRGDLLTNPVHYRDSRTDTMMEETFKLIPSQELYNRTGIQFVFFNSIFQFRALKLQRPELLERADCVLFMPDLFLYLLTGRKKTEYTMASTTQLLNPYSKEWDYEIFEKLGLPRRLFLEIENAGSKALPLSGELCEELGIDPIPTVAVASHDTASAVVSVPAEDENFIYISSGTWSLMGIESDTPLINDLSYKYNFTNEGGFGGKTRFLKNIAGLWLIQESRRQWIREGMDISYADMEQAALNCKPFQCLIDPDDMSLATPGNMPRRIRKLCEQSGQYIPQSLGEVVRCIYESLALKYRLTKEQIEEVSGKKYSVLHVVGGGTKDGLLSQFTANATGIKVIAGPIEATALGNIAVQLISQGALESLAGARRVIAASFDLKYYNPADGKQWDAAFAKYKKLFDK
jgi:rhamnulokinase/L-fuculokinase